MYIHLLLVIIFAISYLSSAEKATSEDIENLALTGWWSDCIFENEDSCAGNYTEISSPIPLDPTGNTCYVNPYVNPTSSTSEVIFWLGPAGSDVMNGTLGILLYTMRVENEDDLPTNCTSGGACSCESLEELRNPWRTTSTCSGGCSATPADDLGKLNETCAVLYKESVINQFFNDTIVTCSIQGTLLDLSTASPSMAPSAGDESTSGGVIRRGGLSSSWFGLVGCSFIVLSVVV